MTSQDCLIDIEGRDQDADFTLDPRLAIPGSSSRSPNDHITLTADGHHVIYTPHDDESDDESDSDSSHSSDSSDTADSPLLGWRSGRWNFTDRIPRLAFRRRQPTWQCILGKKPLRERLGWLSVRLVVVFLVIVTIVVLWLLYLGGVYGSTWSLSCWSYKGKVGGGDCREFVRWKKEAVWWGRDGNRGRPTSSRVEEPVDIPEFAITYGEYYHRGRTWVF